MIKDENTNQESSNKEFIEEWTVNTTEKYSKTTTNQLSKQKRKRPEQTDEEKKEKLDSIELTNAGDLTREEKLKCINICFNQ